MKKILFVGPRKFAPHVGQKNVDLIYPTLLEPLTDCEIHLLHGKPERPDYTNRLADKYGVHFHRVKGGKMEGWIKTAVSIVEKEGIDTLTNVFLGYYYGYIAAKAAQKSGKRSVVRFAANEICVRENAGIYSDLKGRTIKMKDLSREKNAVKLADQVISMSPAEVDRIKKLISDKRVDKVRWCMRGVDLERFFMPEEKNVKKANNFIFVGRKSKEKGYPLIESVAKQMEKDRPEIKFYFAGTFDKKQEGNRNYLGYVPTEKMPDLYAKMDALILPSASEGFPNVIVEAMACGLPCILTADLHSGFFRHRENVLLTQRNEAELLNNILLLHKDSNQYEMLKKESIRTSKEHFDKEYWAKIYREIIIGESNNQSAYKGSSTCSGFFNRIIQFLSDI